MHWRNKIEELCFSCSTDIRRAQPLPPPRVLCCPSLPGNTHVVMVAVPLLSERPGQLMPASAMDSEDAFSQSWMETWHHLHEYSHLIGETNKSPIKDY